MQKRAERLAEVFILDLYIEVKAYYYVIDHHFIFIGLNVQVTPAMVKKDHCALREWILGHAYRFTDLQLKKKK